MATGAVTLIAVAIRSYNALRYRMDLGFDALPNWRYIRGLMDSWALPPPDSGWSTGHPPFFYYFSAGIARLFEGLGPGGVKLAIVLGSSALGLLTVALAVLLVRRLDPDNPRRAFLAAGLLLFLPAHIYLSAMLGEEILSSTLISLVTVGVALALARAPEASNARVGGLGWAAGLGVVAGLAFLTKLSGALVIAAAVGAFVLHGLQRGALRSGLRCGLVLGGVASLVGGWYYLRNLALYGYLYPQDLAVHGVILQMPPGNRELLDYLRIPLATWLDPQLLNPDLLRSVWGGTFATWWFDGHRHFLPLSSPGLQATGGGILALALVPTAACAVGLARSLRRVWTRPETTRAAAERPMLLLVAFTLAGYVHFTWQNPYYVCIKGSYLLGLAVPFSYYASELLAEWTRDRSLRSGAVWASLIGLWLAVSLTFSYGLVFDRLDKPGLPWREVAPVAEPESRSHGAAGLATPFTADLASLTVRVP